MTKLPWEIGTPNLQAWLRNVRRSIVKQNIPPFSYTGNINDAPFPVDDVTKDTASLSTCQELLIEILGQNYNKPDETDARLPSKSKLQRTQKRASHKTFKRNDADTTGSYSHSSLRKSYLEHPKTLSDSNFSSTRTSSRSSEVHVEKLQSSRKTSQTNISYAEKNSEEHDASESSTITNRTRQNYCKYNKPRDKRAMNLLRMISSTSTYNAQQKAEYRSNFSNIMACNERDFEKFCEEYESVAATESKRKIQPDRTAIFTPCPFSKTNIQVRKPLLTRPAMNLPLKFVWNGEQDINIRKPMRRDPSALFFREPTYESDDK